MSIYFGENLKSLREKRKLTQSDLADYLGVSFQTISKWERGNTYPDITLLPVIAGFFGVTVDTLLGINKAENERKINEYISLFDNTYFADSVELMEKFEKAVIEFPSDFRILVRYMELIVEAKDHPFIKICNDNDSKINSTNNPFKLGFVKNPDYEKISQKIQTIYDAIQNQCTDDDIRIRAKRIMIRHLMIKYDLSFDETTEKWHCDTDSLERAKAIADTLPAICDTKECVAIEVNNDTAAFGNIIKSTLEELLFHLQGFLNSYVVYDENLSAKYKIEKIESINNLLDIIGNEEHIGKNEIHLMLNYSRLSYLNSQIGNYDKAFYYLEKCIEIATKLDKKPAEMEKTARFYNLEKPLASGSMRGRMKLILNNHCPFAEEFKAKEKFTKLIEKLNT